MYGYVYLTSNLINGKKYIGQHKSTSFDEQYKGSGIFLQKAIKKYGINNFNTILLEACDSREELNKKEIEYIAIYNAVKSKEYYNIAPGAGGYDAYQYMTEEEKQAYRNKISNTLKHKYSLETLEQKEQRRKAITQGNVNLSDEARRRKSYKLSVAAFKQWEQMPEEKKDERLRKISQTVSTFSPEQKKAISLKKSMSFKNTFLNKSQEEIDEWSKKRADAQRGTISILKEGKFKHVKSEHLQSYLDDGWIVGNLTANTVWMNKDGKAKRISQKDVYQFQQDGWNFGNLKGYKWVTKDGVSKRISIDNLDNYIRDNWILGHPGTGRKK